MCIIGETVLDVSGVSLCSISVEAKYSYELCLICTYECRESLSPRSSDEASALRMRPSQACCPSPSAGPIIVVTKLSAYSVRKVVSSLSVCGHLV